MRPVGRALREQQAEAAKLDAVIVACQRSGYGRQANRKELGYDALPGAHPRVHRISTCPWPCNERSLQHATEAG